MQEVNSEIQKLLADRDSHPKKEPNTDNIESFKGVEVFTKVENVGPILHTVLRIAVTKKTKQKAGKVKPTR